MKSEPFSSNVGEGDELRRYREMAVRQQDSFDHIAALDRALSLKEVSDPGCDLFAVSLPYIESVIAFKGAGYFACHTETLEFELAICRPPEICGRIQQAVDWSIERGTFAWALRQLRPVVLHAPDMSLTLLLHAVVTPTRKIGMFAGLSPLRGITESDFSLPTLTLMLQRTAHAMELQDLYRRIQRHNRELESVVEQRTRELQRLATTDPLTGIFNRRRFFELGARLFEASQKEGSAMVTLMVDLDYFKRINDTMGHGAGDRAIQATAGLLVEMMPEGALYARLGGEEFGVILCGASALEVDVIAENFRRSIEKLDTWHLTVSIGVARREPSDAALEVTLHRSDEALYAAKSGGRNRVVVAALGGDQCK